MSQSWLRILMAAYLAIWSPALCCCDVKLAIGRVTGVDAMACGAAKLASIEMQSRESAPELACCAQRAAEKAATPDVAACAATSSAPNDRDDRCRCRDASDSRIRLDTGAKVILSDLARNELTTPSLMPPIMAAQSFGSILAGLEHGPWPPGMLGGVQFVTLRQQTLLARGCMLLI
ncbi:MAG TPA: hypothetical protein VMS30_05535 [Phycisphaerales bacterium]|nr:hypothetical protein [Phycisphaerales bacterium]